MNASRIVVVLSTLLAVSAWAEHPRPPSGNAYPPSAHPHRVSTVDERLQRAQSALEEALDGNGSGHGNAPRKRALREALDEIIAARAELRGSGPSVPHTPPQPRAIREDAFNALIAALDRERNPEDQLRVLSNAAEGNLFTAQHVQTVMARFSYDAFRLRAAGMLTRKMIDPANAFVLYAQVNGAFDKQALQQLISGANSNQVVVAANDSQLRTFTLAVFQPWSGPDRLSVLNARAGDVLLTSAQLRRLLDGFTSGNNRLAALQTMKRRLVDPQNVEVIVQAFWSPTEQREARRLLGA